VGPFALGGQLGSPRFGGFLLVILEAPTGLNASFKTLQTIRILAAGLADRDDFARD